MSQRGGEGRGRKGGQELLKHPPPPPYQLGGHWPFSSILLLRPTVTDIISSAFGMFHCPQIIPGNPPPSSALLTEGQGQASSQAWGNPSSLNQTYVQSSSKEVEGERGGGRKQSTHGLQRSLLPCNQGESDFTIEFLGNYSTMGLNC